MGLSTYDMFDDKGYHLKMYGEMIGAGQYSIIIKVSNEWNTSDIKKPVMVITRDLTKFELLSNIFKNTEVKIERISKDEELYPDQILEFEFLKHEMDVDIFYMTELEQYQMTEDSAEMLRGFSEGYWESRYKTKSLNGEAIKDDLEAEALNLEDMLEYQIEDKEQVITAVVESFNALNELSNNYEVGYDLHDEQFVCYNDRVYCVDPVVFY